MPRCLDYRLMRSSASSVPPLPLPWCTRPGQVVVIRIEVVVVVMIVMIMMMMIMMVIGMIIQY